MYSRLFNTNQLDCSLGKNYLLVFERENVACILFLNNNLQLFWLIFDPGDQYITLVCFYFFYKLHQNESLIVRDILIVAVQTRIRARNSNTHDVQL